MEQLDFAPLLGKICKCCKKWKVFKEFPRKKRYKDGIYTLCRECKKEKSRVYWENYYENNGDTLRKKQKDYNKKNPDKKGLSEKKWRKNNRDKVLILKKKYYHRHTEKILLKQREYGKNNRPRRRIWAASWRERNRPYIRTYFLAYNKKHSKEYYRRNTERILHNQKMAHARRKGAPGHATLAQVRARVEYYGGLCWICRAVATAIDHVKPITRGGSNWPANLRPICTSCNSKKGNKWPYSLEKE